MHAVSPFISPLPDTLTPEAGRHACHRIFAPHGSQVSSLTNVRRIEMRGHREGYYYYPHNANEDRSMKISDVAAFANAEAVDLSYCRSVHCCLCRGISSKWHLDIVYTHIRHLHKALS